MAMVDASVVAAYLVVAVRPDDYRLEPVVLVLLHRLTRTVESRLGDRLVEWFNSDQDDGDLLDSIRQALETVAAGDEDFAWELSKQCTELRRVDAADLVAEVARRSGRDPRSGASAHPPIDTDLDQRRICPTCGARGPRDQEFCGSCGAYLWLDWAPAEPSLAEPSPAEPPEPSTASPPTASPARASPARMVVPGDLVCGRCGKPNPPARRFCRRCGEELADAAVARSGRGRLFLRANARSPEAHTGRSKRRRSQDTGHRSALDASVQEQIDRAVGEVVDNGRVLFNPAERMQQGRQERVEVAISRTRGLDEQLRTMTRGRGTPRIDDVETSPFMAVELKGPAFEITPLQTAAAGEQLLRETGLWEFDVLPKRSGAHRLQVCLSMRIPLDNRADERVSVPVLERDIRVTVDARYSMNHFLRENWRWCLATLAGLGGALAAWLKLFQGGGS